MKRFAPILTLVAVGIAAATLWRIEVEAHGWHGLTWISYFHWAIPIGILMFASWLGVFSAIHPSSRRIAFSLVFILFAAAAYLGAHTLVTMRCFRMIFFAEPSWWFWWIYNSIFILYPMVPFTFLIIAWLFRQPIQLKQSIPSMVVWLASFPIAMMLLALVNHRGQSDILHAIKSGFVIPFLIISLGLPFVINKKKGEGQHQPRIARRNPG